MEISITAVSGNRRFCKSLVRHSASLKKIEQVVANLHLPICAFEILQIVFVDRDFEDHVRAIGRRRGRLFQVEVAIPKEESMDYGSESAFIKSAVDRVKAASKVSGLSEAVISQLNEALDEAYSAMF